MKSEQVLAIEVRCTDGNVSIFEQSDRAAAVKLVGQLAPGRVFSHPFISIAGSRSLSVFPSASVARLDLLTDLVLDWEFHMGIQDAYEVGPNEFERLADIENKPTARSEGPLTVLTSIEMANARPAHIVIVLNEPQEALMHPDFDILLQRFLSAPSFHARRLGGGGIIINPRHTLRVKFYPCPPEPPKSAWMAETTSTIRG